MPLRNDQYVYRSMFARFKNFPLYTRTKLSSYWRQVGEVLRREEGLKKKTDDEIRILSAELRQRIANGESTDRALAESFALAREAARRTVGMVPYPVQILGGIGLHYGHIVEMATGEGKTLCATMPVYLNALTDRGVHVVTVNDYLASRDADEMGKIYKYLGLTVGVITHDKSPEERMRAYRCSITYGTNKEIGFDYLRDELRRAPPQWFSFGKGVDDLAVQQVQRPDFHFAIIDEADSILIDEARTPLIIANTPAEDEEMAQIFNQADAMAAKLEENVDYSYERTEKRIEWLEAGERRVTVALGGKRSMSGHRVDWHEAVLRAVKANRLFHRDIEYVVEEGEVVIVDENTGRKMPGRQWEEGLHQAVAAKEKLVIKGQTETMARTTYQILFNRYEKLAGMTGTAMTDTIEFAEVYNTGTLRIPTNRPCIRKVSPDKIFATEEEKWQAVVLEVAEMISKKRAVLLGTRSIEKSELISEKLKAAGIEHVVLNARNEAEEAEIVKDAGIPGRVTVSTNMAGRGTDIKLTDEVFQNGGLHVIGTERHESRRIDNQLRGRSARQGDPGSAQFFVSLEDPLIRRYRPKASARLSRRFAGRNQPIRSVRIRQFFRKVQLSIENQHRRMRNDLIKYDRERSKFNKQLGTE